MEAQRTWRCHSRSGSPLDLLRLLSGSLCLCGEMPLPEHYDELSELIMKRRKREAMMKAFNYRSYARYGLALLIAVGVSLAVVANARLADSPDQDIQKLNRFMQTAKGNTAAMQMFR